MENALARLLRCPFTGARLRLRVFAREGEEVSEGVLVAARGGHWYPVTRGVPRMLPPSIFDRGEFVARHRRRLGRLGLDLGDAPREGALAEVKRRTAESFTFEWKQYRRFGWDDPRFDLERERRVFLRKTISSEGDWAGRLTLDAGCGNGRYSYWAARFGATVVGMDISEAVETAYQNLRLGTAAEAGDEAGRPEVHLVQGDIFRPPFAPGTFEVVFSIGVLMLTGDARRATHSLARLLAPGGLLTVNVYGTGNPLYELNDRLIRRCTTRMDLQSLLRFTGRMARFADWCDRRHLLNIVNAFVRLENHPHCIFDWYSAPVATHHTDREVASWFSESALEVLAVESGRPGSLNRAVGRALRATAFRAGSSVRVQGRRPSPAPPPDGKGRKRG